MGNGSVSLLDGSSRRCNAIEGDSMSTYIFRGSLLKRRELLSSEQPFTHNIFRHCPVRLHHSVGQEFIT